MAGSLTNFGELAALDALFNAGTIYLALFTAAPGEAGGGTEASGGSYARTAISFGAASGTAPAQVANDAAVNFPTASGSWGTVTHFAIFDASTSGNMIAYGDLGASKTIASGDSASAAIGAIVVTAD